MYIRKDDLVEVISGSDRGQRAKVLRVLPKDGAVVVQGVNVARKHVRPNRKNPRGGVIEKEMPIPACKVMVVDPVTNKPTRLGVRYRDDGSKELFAKKSGTMLRVIAPPRARHAKKPAAAQA